MTQSADDRIEVVDTERVLLEEYRGFWPDDSDQPADESSYRRRVFEQGQAALCLSGGGARSAAFGLGVIEALSQKRLLTGFHYVSTVGGGGYVGGWLQQWMLEAQGGPDEVMIRLGGAEPREVSALRRSFCRAGGRADTGHHDIWTRAMVFVRNIAVNWLLIGPLLLLIVLVPKLLLPGLVSIPERTQQVSEIQPLLLGLSAIPAALSAWFVVRGLPSHRATTRLAAAPEYWLTKRIVIPLMCWALLGTMVVAIDIVLGPALRGMAGAAFAVVSFAAALLGLVVSGLTLPKDDFGLAGRRVFTADLTAWIISLLLSATFVVLGARLFAFQVGASAFHGLGEASAEEIYFWVSVLTVVAPAWLLLSQLVGFILFVTFRRREAGYFSPEADSEWLARLSGMLIRPLLLWAVAAFSILFLWSILVQRRSDFDLSLSGGLALLTGIVAALGGRAGERDPASHPLLRFVPLQPIVAVATGLSAILLVVVPALVADGLAKLVARMRIPWTENLPAWADPTIIKLWLFSVLLVLMLVALRRRVDVNRFSLTWIARNRLARTYLGSARPERRENVFTRFDPADNSRVADLARRVGPRNVLYPVVNATLNVSPTDDIAGGLAPFVFSPRYSGSAMLAPEEAAAGAGAYVRSALYAHETEIVLGGSGITLATAMAISGASGDRKSGYHPSPLTALLMTLFSVRLGAWLPNPARARTLGGGIRQAAPSNPVRALLGGLVGPASDRERDIFLSDGGHFENLGLYEMIRRRCRYIVVCDAGADPDCGFADLGNAVRRVKVDFDVDVHFEELRIFARDAGEDPKFAFALGTVDYPEMRYRGENLETPEARAARTGRLLYIKPSYFGTLPVDLRAYGAENPAFPHEATDDRFVTESQFESYHRLGLYLATNLGGGEPTPDIEAFFAAIEAQHLSLTEKEVEIT